MRQSSELVLEPACALIVTMTTVLMVAVLVPQQPLPTTSMPLVSTKKGGVAAAVARTPRTPLLEPRLPLLMLAPACAWMMAMTTVLMATILPPQQLLLATSMLLATAKK